MEQHPTLPLVAVSGIDDTVKVSHVLSEISIRYDLTCDQLFAPTAQRPDPSYSRLHLRDTIINANTQRPRYRSSAFGRGSLLQFLASRGLVARVEGAEGEDDESEALQQCATQ